MNNHIYILRRHCLDGDCYLQEEFVDASQNPIVLENKIKQLILEDREKGLTPNTEIFYDLKKIPDIGYWSDRHYSITEVKLLS